MKNNYTQARKNMVERQIIPRGINNRKVIEAFLTVPRHKFVPDRLKDNAYEDRPLPIKEGQTISQPFIVAQMIEALNPETEDKILEIGTGSGYASAVLSRIVDMVYGIERLSALAKNARQKFEELKYNNIKIKVGDGTTGWKENSPYDGIMVSAAAPEIPENLVKQLKTGGYLVIPAGNKRIQDLYQVKKIENGTLDKKQLGKVRFVPLIGKKGWAFE